MCTQKRFATIMEDTHVGKYSSQINPRVRRYGVVLAHDILNDGCVRITDSIKLKHDIVSNN